MEKDIQRQLYATFPEEVVQRKDAGYGNQVDFVPWHRYAERLNNLDVTWETEVTQVVETGGKLLLVVAVTIEGETRVGTGSADAAKDSWGGAHSEAFSQAFRRACAAHGLGLYFYHRPLHKAPDTEEASEPEVRGDGPTPAQKKRLSQLQETGQFTNAELEEWRSRLTQSWTQSSAGVVLREMKEAYEQRTGEDFAPPETS